jgi:hypothetical protein
MTTENSLDKQHLLAPGVQINSQDMELLKSALEKGINQNLENSISNIAVLTLINFQDAVKNVVNSRNIDFDLNKSIPSTDKDPLKANIIKGMFITFLENENSLPGFFKIFGGIGATGFGIGALQFSSPLVNLKKAELLIPSAIEKEIKKCQTSHLLNSISGNYITSFSDFRRGLLCAILSGALIPIYLMAICKSENVALPLEHHVQKAQKIVLEKFNSGSPGVKRLFSQNLFATMFDTLFSHTSTVHSIFSSQ